MGRKIATVLIRELFLWTLGVRSITSRCRGSHVHGQAAQADWPRFSQAS